MSLPACQQRVLDRVEQSLYACDPRLRSKFAIFTKLPRQGPTIMVQCLSVCAVTTSDQTLRRVGTNKG
jgi:Protein of unknown function (DUF3040)